MIPPVPCVLKVERLEKSFGDVRAVKGVSFHVAPGEISDVMQYVWGKSIGRHRVLPRVSPNSAPRSCNRSCPACRKAGSSRS